MIVLSTTVTNNHTACPDVGPHPPPPISWRSSGIHNFDLALVLQPARSVPSALSSDHPRPGLPSPLGVLPQTDLYPLCPRAEQQSCDLVAIIERGNHESAKAHPATLEKMLHDKVLHGWQLVPLPVEAVHMIPSAVVAPLGMVTQFSIDEQVNRIEKFRLHHPWRQP